MINKTLKKGKVVTLKSDLYYNINREKLIAHYSKPADLIYIYQKSGETKIYNPQKNTVTLVQSDHLKTSHTLISIFINQKTNNLGLQKLGFQMENTVREDNYLITYWKPPKHIKSDLDKVKLVHKDQLPIYSAHFNTKGNIIKKAYYSQYKYFKSFMLPKRVTEIQYLSNNDSLISRITLDNIHIGKEANSPYFYYKIPNDAKIKK